MRKIQRSIDVVCTFIADKPPVPHRFRVRDRNDNVHVLRIGKILQIEKEKHSGDDVWTYKCQGMIGSQERIYVIRFNVSKASWQLVKI